MIPKKTFVDAGVLIDAARGKPETAGYAMRILDDPEREFVSSPFVKLEVLPKAIYEKNQDEAEFYKTFFDAVTHWPKSVEEVTSRAVDEACKFGLSAVDALHVAAAVIAGADILITTEKPEKPIFRVTSIRIVSVRPDALKQ